MRHLALLALLTGAAAALPACRRGDDAPAASTGPVVFVTVLPQAYLARRVAGEHAQVDVLVGPGQNPHLYEPTPRQMTRLAGARAFFRVGVPFEESLLPRLSANAALRIVDTRRGIDLLAEEAHGTQGHDHGAAPHSAPPEGETDPHIWLSPRLAKVQAQTMCQALAEIDPPHRADFERNLQQLQADLDALDAEIAAALAPLKGRTFFVFHPAFGYFARDYGLRQEAVETGGKAPGPRHVKELIDRARREGVRVIFVEPQFSRQAAASIARQIDGAVVAIDPLSADYLANLRDVAGKIRQALAATTAPAEEP